jgi:hypothetical protein
VNVIIVISRLITIPTKVAVRNVVHVCIHTLESYNLVVLCYIPKHANILCIYLGKDIK